jgi:hypothetical protein
MKTLKVQQAPDKPVATEILAENIVALADGVRKLRSGRLNDKAIVLLLHHSCGVKMTDIKAVFHGIETLEATYLKKPPSK